MASSDGMFIPKRMHLNPAFRKLTTNSIFVLLEFLSRRQMVKVGRRDRWITKNNGEIIFTYADAWEKFKMFRSTFCRSIRQLVELGFIDITHHERSVRNRLIMKRASKVEGRSIIAKDVGLCEGYVTQIIRKKIRSSMEQNIRKNI